MISMRRPRRNKNTRAGTPRSNSFLESNHDVTPSVRDLPQKGDQEERHAQHFDELFDGLGEMPDSFIIPVEVFDQPRIAVLHTFYEIHRHRDGEARQRSQNADPVRGPRQLGPQKAEEEQPHGGENGSQQHLPRVADEADAASFAFLERRSDPFMHGRAVIDGDVGEEQGDQQPADAAWPGNFMPAANCVDEPCAQGHENGLGDGEPGRQSVFTGRIEQPPDGTVFRPAQPVDRQVQVDQGDLHNQTGQEDYP